MTTRTPSRKPRATSAKKVASHANPSKTAGREPDAGIKRSLKKKSMVLIEWLDAYQVGFWQDGNEDLEAEPTLVKTLGWVLKEGRSAIYLAQSLADDNHGNAIVIPHQMIKRTVVLKEE
jgi:hypothetical protein